MTANLEAARRDSRPVTALSALKAYSLRPALHAVVVQFGDQVVARYNISIILPMPPTDKLIVWLCDSPQSPPLSEDARKEAEWLLRQLQHGITPTESKKVKNTDFHRLRFEDDDHSTSWRIYYRVDDDAIVIIDFCVKKTQKITKHVMSRLGNRLKTYDEGNK